MLLLSRLTRSVGPQLWCLIALLASSCGQPSTSTPITEGTNLQGQSVPVRLGPGYLTAIAWPRTGWLIIGFAAHPEAVGPSAQQVWRLRADGSDAQQISIPSDPRCPRTEYDGPTALPDGRVGLVKKRRTIHPSDDQRYDRHQNYTQCRSAV